MWQITSLLLLLGFSLCLLILTLGTVLCLSVDFFEFILLGVCGVPWIWTFISFTRFGMFSAILSLSFSFWLHCALCGNFPDQGLNLCPLQWKHRLVTTGPLGKFLQPVFLQMFFCLLSSPSGILWLCVHALDSVLQVPQALLVFLHFAPLIGYFE